MNRFIVISRATTPVAAKTAMDGGMTLYVR